MRNPICQQYLVYCDGGGDMIAIEQRGLLVDRAKRGMSGQGERI